MPFLTSAPISALAVELLSRSLTLVATVARVPTPEYGGPSGGSVTLRVPQPRTAQEQAVPGATITYSDLNEVPVNVTVKHFYDATRVTDEDLSLSLQGFGRQILRPQITAVAQRAEDELAGRMNALPLDTAIQWKTASTGAVNPADDVATILKARQKFSALGVPAGSRFMAVAPDIATRLLSVAQFTEADKRGGSTALDEASIGRVYGIDFIESAAILAGTAVAYHSSAFAFGSAPPTPPPGVDSTRATDGNLTLRHLLAFDASRLATGSVVSVFAGAAAVPEDAAGTIRRAIRVGTAVSV